MQTQIEVLENEIYLLKQKLNKYGLNWRHKQEDIEEILKNNIVVLKECEKSISNSKNGLNHMLIEGDNLLSLRTLLFAYKGLIKVIYIDPPYNTGNKDFKYNDNFIDKDDEERHSKWLSFMNSRLYLAKELLTEDGVIFISIDDNEFANLKLLCDIVFNDNFICNFVRKNKGGSGHDSSEIAIEYDYMLCYSKNKNKISFNKQIVNVKEDPKYKMEDEFVERRGKYYLRDLDYKGSYSKSLDYGLETPDGEIIYSGEQLGGPNTWRWSKEKVEWGKTEGFIVFKKIKQKWKVYIKQYQFVDHNDKLRIRKLPHRGLIEFSNAQGSKELKEILTTSTFSYPKPTSLIKFILNLIPDKNCIVLDFFAGSGTTAQAILSLNQEDNGKRKIILCTNNENNICDTDTYPRFVKSIEKYKNTDNLKYYKTKLLKNDSLDSTKYNQFLESIDMIKNKDNCYELIVQTDDYSIFESCNKITAIVCEFSKMSEIKDLIGHTDKKIEFYEYSPNQSSEDGALAMPHLLTKSQNSL